MLKSKKLLSILLASILTFSTLLVGCGKKDAATSNPQSKDDLKPVELSWYFLGNGQAQDVTKVEEEVNKYIKDKINAKVKLTCFDWGSYNDKLGNMIAAGEQFDICFTCSWTNLYRENSVRGAFVPLNDDKKLMDKYMPKTKELLGSHFLKGSEINGLNYAIPCNKEKAHQIGFLLREDLVKKYNFDVKKVKSLEDLEPYLKVIKEKEPGIYPLEATQGENPDKLLDFDAICDDAPGVLYYDSKDMKVFNYWEAPETKQLLKTMRKYYLAGYVRKDAATVQDFNADETAGKVFALTKNLKPGKDKEVSLSTGHPWMQIEITKPKIYNFNTMGSMMAVSRTSKNPERALMFLELVNTDKYLNNLINYGIENTHYTKVSDNVIKKGPQNDKYNPGTQWVFGNVFINYLWENEDAKKWENFERFNKEAIPSKTLGFIFDPSAVKNELAACKVAGKDFGPGLMTGTLDPDEYLPKLQKSLKDAGIDKIIAEEQKQLDDWIKKNKK